MNGNFAGWNTVFKNIKVNDPNFRDTSLLFAPPADNVYFIAFHCYSDKNASTVLIDDIEMGTVKALPVKLSVFTASRSGEKNAIVWKTLAEVKCKSFELQKSVDGYNFTTLKTVASKSVNGSSFTTLEYTEEDSRPFIGATYYRLRIMDTDNETFLSQVINVKAPLLTKITYNKIYPNPVSGNTVSLIVTSPYNAKGTLLVTDTYGKVLINMPVSVFVGDNNFKVDVSKLGKGVYMSKFSCTVGGETDGKAFIKQ
jgi:hypothetical protein